MTLAAVLVVLPLAGCAYEAFADAHTRRTFQAPGLLVDIGGRRLHLVCIGDGSPIVLFEAPGFGVSSLSSATVRERVASRTTVCSYDRAGMGWSDPAPARAIGTLAAIMRGASDTVREFRAAPPLSADVPLVVLSASDPRLLVVPGSRQLSAVRSETRLRGHKRLAAASIRGVWKTVPNSQHLIAVSNPEAVIDEIFAILDTLR